MAVVDVLCRFEVKHGQLKKSASMYCNCSITSTRLTLHRANMWVEVGRRTVSHVRFLILTCLAAHRCKLFPKVTTYVLMWLTQFKPLYPSILHVYSVKTVARLVLLYALRHNLIMQQYIIDLGLSITLKFCLLVDGCIVNTLEHLDNVNTTRQVDQSRDNIIQKKALPISRQTDVHIYSLTSLVLPHISPNGVANTVLTKCPLL